ncbi:hypothetical protein M5D96_010387 [Drosophila gunungcola]|uniref:HMG box domain-containing protein n=1 Tax=Drosophila gunungcola TaxID=103775 RepID=A0A9P9YHI1_9MUSC|nr:hypothetical protein M5D96_010387 [Drosophila gunungcola]
MLDMDGNPQLEATSSASTTATITATAAASFLQATPDTVYGTYDAKTNSITIVMDGDAVPVNEAVEEIYCDGVTAGDDSTDVIMKCPPPATSPSQVYLNMVNATDDSDDESNFDHINPFLRPRVKAISPLAKSPALSLHSATSDHGYESILGSPMSVLTLPTEEEDFPWESNFEELFPNSKKEQKWTEPAIEGPDAVMESTESMPIASQSLDSAAIEQFEDEKPAKGKKKPKNPKGRHSESAVGSELKKLGQRRINVAGAPKMPLNGYVRFMNDRREELRREQPQRTALEHTRIIGEEWHQLPEERKVPYMEAAAKDKAIYQEQLQMFLQEHPEIVTKELAKAKKVTKLESSSKEKTPKAETSSAKAKKPKAKQVKRQSEDPDDVPLAKPAPINVAPPAPRPLQPGEIPIYTNEFIEHNRSTENELRTLRKAKTDLEQQNAVLEQHVDNTKAGYAKVMGEVTELMDENRRLETYVRGLRQKLVAALGGISLPPLEPSGPSVGNIDKYIRHLAGLVGQPNNVTLLKAREALRKLDTSSLLKP